MPPACLVIYYATLCMPYSLSYCSHSRTYSLHWNITKSLGCSTKKSAKENIKDCLNSIEEKNDDMTTMMDEDESHVTGVEVISASSADEEEPLPG